MRKLLFALLFLAVPAAGQTLDVVVSGGVSYRVATADSDSTISTHATYHVALESAANFALATGRMALILHTSETRVRAILPQPPVVDPDTVVTPDPGPDDPVDPEPEPPTDTIAPPPADTVPTPPTDTVPPPTGGNLILDINPGDHASLSSFLAPANVTDGTLDHTRANGWAALSLEDTGPNPWGTNKSIRATFFNNAPRDANPQAGVYYNFAPSDEIWLRYEYRFSPNWWSNSHKFFILYEGGIGVQRWGAGWGGLTRYGSGGREPDPDHFQLFAYPPLSGSFGSMGGWNAVDWPPVSNQLLHTNSTRNMPPGMTPAWDGNWHVIHARFRRSTTDALVEAWHDGVQVLDLSGFGAPLMGAGFADIIIGANINNGPAETQWYEQGRIQIWSGPATPPGWPGN